VNFEGHGLKGSKAGLAVDGLSSRIVTADTWTIELLQLKYLVDLTGPIFEGRFAHNSFSQLVLVRLVYRAA